MNDYTLGYICGILAVLLIAVVIRLIFRKKKMDCKEGFDERQLFERGNAYKLGFTTFMIEFAIYILYTLGDFGYEIPVEPAALASIALFIPVTIFCVYAVRHDAFMGYNATGKSFYWLYILAFVLNIIPAIMSICDGSLIENGVLTLHSTNLIVAIMFGGILLALYAKNREDKEEE